MYEIEKDVPIPEKIIKMSTRYPFRSMEIGDSFLIRPRAEGLIDNKPVRLIQTGVIASFNWFRRNHPEMSNWRIKTRYNSDNDELRIWRIE